MKRGRAGSLLRSVATTVLVAASCTSGDRGEPAPAIEAAPCPQDIELLVLSPHDCGFLTAPEDRADPSGATVRLFYVHVSPAGGSAEPEAVASLGYEIGQAPSYASIVTIAENSGREFYLLDQRGVGHSEPSLTCPEVEAVSPDIAAEPLPGGREIFVDAVTACRERLVDEGVTLGAYTIAAVADDLEDLRRAVGVSSWNIISWGSTSRFLLDYASRFPDRVRALVMDSPQFPGADPVSGAADDLGTALRALAQTCATSEVCDRRYPDLERAFAEAVADLDGAPIAGSVRGADVTVDGAALVRIVRHLLSFNDAQAWGDIPRLVYRALVGDVKAVAATLSGDPGMCLGYLPRCNEPISLGAYLSFTCPEVPASPPDASRLADAYGAADPYVDACGIWGVESSESEIATSSDVPALVMRGEYDSFSSLADVQGVEAIFPNAHVTLVPFQGHDLYGTYDCLREARNAWLLAPQGEPDFDACIRTIQRPRFH